MNYLSVCSGIEAATVAWHPLGWKPFAFSEIEKFPSAVLAHHYPQVPNLGDMARFKDWPDADIDVLVGGTPCQSFSVAGLRKGMADPRGSLALTYLAIADRYRPEWLVWENVPGVLSSSEGRDFGAFIGGLAELGYHASWRVLDAQYVRVDGFARAVPQRRRRVFVVGHLGDWRRAAAVLFERESLLWDSPPRRQAGQRASGTISARPTGGGGLGTDFDIDGGIVPTAFGGNDTSGPIQVATARNAHGGPMGRLDFESETFLVAHSLRAEGFDASQGVAGTIGQNVDRASGGAPCIAHAYDLRGREGGSQFEGPHDTANIRAASGGSSRSYLAQQWAARRLTPRECERLQGFPDDYTRVPMLQTGRKAGPVWAADGPRYKALGNSMAVNVMRWIGNRIAMVNAL